MVSQLYQIKFNNHSRLEPRDSASIFISDGFKLIVIHYVRETIIDVEFIATLRAVERLNIKNFSEIIAIIPNHDLQIHSLALSYGVSGCAES